MMERYSCEKQKQIATNVISCGTYEMQVMRRGNTWAVGTVLFNHGLREGM